MKAIVTSDCWVFYRVLALTWAAGHTGPRMGTDALQPGQRLSVTQRARLARLARRLPRYPKRLPRLSHWSMLARVWVDDMTPAQPPASANAPDYPTTRLPDYPTTRLPDYRAPLADSLSANPVAADRSASALTVAPSIRVAHTRRASVRLPADRSAAAATSPHQPAMPAARSRWITSSTATGRGGAHACRSARRASKEARDKGLTQRPSGCGRERVSPSLDGRAGEGPAVKSALSNNIFGGQSL